MMGHDQISHMIWGRIVVTVVILLLLYLMLNSIGVFRG